MILIPLVLQMMPLSKIYECRCTKYPEESSLKTFFHVLGILILLFPHHILAEPKLVVCLFVLIQRKSKKNSVKSSYIK